MAPRPALATARPTHAVANASFNGPVSTPAAPVGRVDEPRGGPVRARREVPPHPGPGAARPLPWGHRPTFILRREVQVRLGPAGPACGPGPSAAPPGSRRNRPSLLHLLPPPATSGARTELGAPPTGPGGLRGRHPVSTAATPPSSAKRGRRCRCWCATAGNSLVGHDRREPCAASCTGSRDLIAATGSNRVPSPAGDGGESGGKGGRTCCRTGLGVEVYRVRSSAT